MKCSKYLGIIKLTLRYFQILVLNLPFTLPRDLYFSTDYISFQIEIDQYLKVLKFQMHIESFIRIHVRVLGILKKSESRGF
jgi:hypothetical protein